MFARNEGSQYQTGDYTNCQHGGANNLIIWPCMGWNGVGELVEVQGKIDAAQYCEVLEEGVEESFESLEMAEGEQYFQQDNDSKHTSRKATSSP